MKTTVEISDPLLREAKQAAARDGITLRELIESGLRRVLDDRKTAKPFVMRDCSNKEAKLQPWIREGDWKQIREILYGVDAPDSPMGRLVRSLKKDES